MSCFKIALAMLCDSIRASPLCCGEGSGADYGTEFAVSAFLSENSVRPPTREEDLRSVFTDVPLTYVKPPMNHTHGVSAAGRNSASLFVDRVSKAVGQEVVFFQGSASDLRNNRKVTRSYFWTKDLSVPPERHDESEDKLVAMVDVDYYVDMPRYLRNSFRPVLLYTLQPSTVAKPDGEYKFTFEADNRIRYCVSGGADYHHYVWCYEGDSLKVTKKLFGFVYSMSTYLIERRFVDEDHQMILLVPTAKFSGFAAWIACRTLSGRELKRLEPVVAEEFLRLNTNSKSGLVTHTGRVGGYAAASIPTDVDDEIASMARTSKVGLTLPMVKGKVKDSLRGVEILHEFHTKAYTGKRIALSIPDPYVRTYQWVDKLSDYDAEAKPSMVSFMAPLLDGAFAPAMCRNNDKRAIDTRVNAQKNEVTLTPFLVKVVDEFVEQFYGGKFHTLEPVGYDEVLERQDRPAQRRILATAEYEVANRVTKSFMKRECYQSVTDPRNISQICGVDKREYSQFMYALSDYLKLMPWYAFGHTPRVQAERVVAVLFCALMAILTDFSRMDGRVNEFVRYLEEQLMLKGFRESYRSELLRLLRTQRNLQGRTKHGVKYETDWTRLSGSPETSPFNTILNAFVAFLAFRMTLVLGAYLTAAQAWSRLGLYGGDDGVTANVDPAVYARAASMVGQKLTASVIQRGEVGVQFLARQYGPDVWFGDPNSCCDFARVISKFHTTVTMPMSVTPIDKLRDKSHALWLSDKESPVVGPFTNRVRKLFGPIGKFKNIGGKYLFTIDENEQYPNEFADWMVDLAYNQLESFDFDSYFQWLENTTVESILKPPGFAPPVELETKPGVVVVDDDVFVDGKPLTAGKACEEGGSSKRKRVRKRKPKSQRPSRLNKAPVGANQK